MANNPGVRELTQTLKVKRQYITDKYQGLTARLQHDMKGKKSSGVFRR